MMCSSLACLIKNVSQLFCCIKDFFLEPRHDRYYV
jgi:hypothetical protein